MNKTRIDELTHEECLLIFEKVTGFPFKHPKRDVKTIVGNYLRGQKKDPDEILFKIYEEKRRQPSCAKSF